jgi:hypothetical protein
MGEHGFDRLAGYATALHDGSGELFEILSGFHLIIYDLRIYDLRFLLNNPKRLLQNAEYEIIRAEDVAIAQAADLSTGDELYQARGIGTRAIDIDGDRHHLLATDAVAVGGGHIPHAPRDTLKNLLDLAVFGSAIGNLRALGDAP